MRVEIESKDDPGERLVVCRNPKVSEKNARTREELIAATEELFKPIIAATTREKSAPPPRRSPPSKDGARRPLKGADKRRRDGRRRDVRSSLVRKRFLPPPNPVSP